MKRFRLHENSLNRGCLNQWTKFVRYNSVPFMQRVLYFLTVFFLSNSAFQMGALAQGAGSSGGGDVVVTRSGSALLVDLLTTSDLDSESFLNEAKVRKKIFERHPWSNYLLRPAFSLIPSGVEVLTQFETEFPILKDLIIRAKNLDIAFSEAYFTPDQLQMLSDLPGITTSERVARDLQVPVAVFEYQTVLLNERLYLRMSERDQKALLVHELLRLLNFYMDDAQALSTAEIEKLNRYFFLNERDESVLIKFKALTMRTVSVPAALSYAFPKDRKVPEVTLHAELMRSIQQAAPQIKFTAPMMAGQGDFAQMVRSSLWRRNVQYDGKLNVLTHEIVPNKNSDN